VAVILRVRTTLDYGTGGPGLNTMYFRPGTPGGSNADAADVASRVRAFWFAIKVIYPSLYFLRVQSDVAAIEATTGALTGLFNGGAQATVTGTGAGTFMPKVAMILLQQRSALVVNGRLLKGRSYLGPVDTGSLTGSGVVSGATVALVVGATPGLQAVAPTLSQPVIWHRPGGAGAGADATITNYAVWSEFAELRSRRDG
jgi:hypothetical protein